METYFYNTGNKQHYKILARYFDNVMLLESKNHNYIVARWIRDTNEHFFMGEWGSGHYWMDNKQGAINDFYQIVTDAINERMNGRNYITINKVKELYAEA